MEKHVRGAGRIESAVASIKRTVFAKHGEPYRIAGYTLRYVPGSAPVSLRRINSSIAVQRYDALQLKLLTELLHEGDRAIDIGARTGSHALVMAALCGRSGQVIAFEPNPGARDVLFQNIALNPSIKSVAVENVAVSDRTDTATFYSRRGVDDYARLASPATPDAMAFSVTTISLDEYLASHPGPQPRVVKIDVEGAEIAVLRGARKLLAGESTILCELHPESWPQFGVSVDDLKLIAKAAGRGVRYIHEDHEIGNSPLYGIVVLER